MKKIKKLLNKHKTILAHQQFKYLNEAHYNTSIYSSLPKRQKSQLVTYAIKEKKNLKSLLSTVSPIGLSCPTRRLSELIDTLLKSFLKHVKIYIRGSIDFLNKCDRNTDGNTVIATFEPVGPCTNIPHTLGWRQLGPSS